jgi:hypothetical protein
MSKSNIYKHLLMEHLSGSARRAGKNVVYSMLTTAKPNVGTLGKVDLPVNALTASIKLVLGDDSMEKYVPPARNGADVLVALELSHFKFFDLSLLDPNDFGSGQSHYTPPHLRGYLHHSPFSEYDDFEAFPVDLGFLQKFGGGVERFRNTFYSDTLRKRTTDSWAMIPFDVVKL